MLNGILLGFEIGTHEPVHLPRHHAGFTGMTGKAGKSTAIEGAGQRSNMRTLAFLTKRGEQAFHKAKRIPLFYQERSDWRFVQSLLEAELREDKRFERAWIIKVCRGTQGQLRKVWDNVKEAKAKARKDSLSERVYICLDAYFEIIIPELEKHDFSKTLEIGKDPITYVMDLIGMNESTQAVIMQSALEWVHKHEKGVIVTVPEAWKFIGLRGTPVLDIAERIIKQGFAVKVFLWVDSQDIASINPRIRGQIDNWVLGRQRYEHEIKRTLGFIPVKNKPTVEQIQTLRLGHFFVACEDWVKHVYALPYGVPEDEGIAVALGKKTPEEIRDTYLKPKPLPTTDEILRRRIKELEAERDLLKEQNKALTDHDVDVEDVINKRVAERTKDLQDTVDRLEALIVKTNKDFERERQENEEALGVLGDEVKRSRVTLGEQEETIKQQSDRILELEKNANIGEAIRGILQHMVRQEVEVFRKDVKAIADSVKTYMTEIHEHPERFDITVSKTATKLTVEKKVRTLTLSDEDLAGRIAIVYAEGLLPTKAFSLKALNKIMTERFGRKEAYPNFKKVIRDYVKWGFFKVVQAGGRQDYQVALTPDEAKQQGLLIIKDVNA